MSESIEGLRLNHAAVVSDLDADSRWRDWQARGAARDRHTAALMRALMFLIIAALTVWSVVLFA